MKQLKIEETTNRILEVVHELFPKYKIPSDEQLHLFNAPRNLLGLGGANYGVGANPRVYGSETGLDNAKFIDTIIHELVHHNGFRGHGPYFQRELGRVGTAAFKRLKEKYPDDTKNWEISYVQKAKAIIFRAVSTT